MRAAIEQNKGIALITVLLVVALASAAAAAMASRHQLDIRRTQNVLTQGQAMMYAMAIEQWVQQILYRDKQDNKTDHMDEDWAKIKPVLPVENGTLIGELEDLQGRYNLNNLRQSGDAGKEEVKRFKRLLHALELNVNLAEQIQDWIDADQQAGFPEGAEDLNYLGQENNPYRTSDQMMQSPSELLLLKLMTASDYEKLAPFVCTLPDKTAININTATPEVLMTLAEGLVLSELQDLAERRDEDPYDSVDKMLTDKVFAGKTIKTAGLSVDSQYFMLKGEANINHIHQPIIVIYKRDDKGIVRSIMRAEGNI